MAAANMFRTDRGDDEGGSEWANERMSGTKDGNGSAVSTIENPDFGADPANFGEVGGSGDPSHFKAHWPLV